jgi:hypothetical protein
MNHAAHTSFRCHESRSTHKLQMRASGAKPCLRFNFAISASAISSRKQRSVNLDAASTMKDCVKSKICFAVCPLRTYFSTCSAPGRQRRQGSRHVLACRLDTNGARARMIQMKGQKAQCSMRQRMVHTHPPQCWLQPGVRIARYGKRCSYANGAYTSDRARWLQKSELAPCNLDASHGWHLLRCIAMVKHKQLGC